MTKSEISPGLDPAYVIFEFERRAYPIGQEAFTIGRSGSCDIVVREPSVSRIHAELSRGEKGVVLKPMGTMPTNLNGLPATAETTLRRGDTIAIGTAILTFAEGSLPIGVSVIDRSKRRQEDVGNRRLTLTNPILAGKTNPNNPEKPMVLRPAVMLMILLVVAAYYFGVVLR